MNEAVGLGDGGYRLGDFQPRNTRMTRKVGGLTNPDSIFCPTVILLGVVNYFGFSLL